MAFLTRLDASNQMSPIRIQEKQELYEPLLQATCKVTWKSGIKDMETTGTLIRFREAMGVLAYGHKQDEKDTRVVAIIAANVFSRMKTERHVPPSLTVKQDICVLDSPKTENPYFDIGEDFATPELGEKVYFAGYPLGQNTPVVHRGRVSSMGENSFTIDGVVITGNSGGAVVALRNNQIALLGVIHSQVVD